MADKDRRINLRFDDQTFRRLNRKRAELDTSFQEIGEKWFLEWLAGERSGDIIPECLRELSQEEGRVLSAVLEWILRNPELDADDPTSIKPSLLELGRRWAARNRSGSPG